MGASTNELINASYMLLITERSAHICYLFFAACQYIIMRYFDVELTSSTLIEESLIFVSVHQICWRHYVFGFPSARACVRPSVHEHNIS